MPMVVATPVLATLHTDGAVAGSGMPNTDGSSMNNDQNRAVSLVDDGHSVTELFTAE